MTATGKRSCSRGREGGTPNHQGPRGCECKSIGGPHGSRTTTPIRCSHPPRRGSAWEGGRTRYSQSHPNNLYRSDRLPRDRTRPPRSARICLPPSSHPPVRGDADLRRTGGGIDLRDPEPRRGAPEDVHRRGPPDLRLGHGLPVDKISAEGGQAGQLLHRAPDIHLDPRHLDGPGGQGSDGGSPPGHRGCPAVPGGEHCTQCCSRRA